jgi:hypothetical protein
MWINMISVVADVATLFYHLLEAPGHGLHQVLEVGGVPHPDDPQPQDLLIQLLQVAGAGALQWHLHPGPHISIGLRSGRFQAI